MADLLADANTVTPGDLITELGAAMGAAFSTLEAGVQVTLTQQLALTFRSYPTVMERLASIRALEDYIVAHVAAMNVQELVNQAVQAAYAAGSGIADLTLAAAEPYTTPRVFGVPSALDAAAQIGKELINRFNTVTANILRNVPDMYQQAVATVAPGGILGGTPVLTMQQQIVERLLSNGITGFTDAGGRNWRLGSYAEMATRTATMRAWSAGSIATFQASGFNIVTPIGSHTACELCLPWQGQHLSTDGTPPGIYLVPSVLDNSTVELRVDATLQDAQDQGFQHPNAVLEGSTFIPFGRVTEMVRSRYSGPAVTLSTRLSQTTIGPNHPVMTLRGLVPAKELREGDYLVYDSRAVDPTRLAAADLDLHEVPLVQDSFQALARHFGHASIPAASHNFHGDAVYCQGEIEVVLPHHGLLNELDPAIPEGIREHDLVWSDVETEALTSLRAKHDTAEGVFLTAASSMRGLGTGGFQVAVPLESVTTAHWEGWAFDASTEHSLYCSDGLVVSNCRDVLVAVMPGLDTGMPQIPGFDPGVDVQMRDAETRLRALEVKVRDAKRMADITTALGNPGKAASYRSIVAARQHDIRQLVATTGVQRKPYREQLAFADGSARTRNAALFVKQFEANVPAEYSAFVNHYTVPEVADMKAVRMTNNGKTGLLVHDWGDGRIEMTGLYNGSDVKGGIAPLINQAIQEDGVNYAECFGDHLRATYERYGFHVVESYPFDPTQAPADWNGAKFDSPPYYILER